MTLAWRQRDQYHTRSECGRFSVSRLNVCGSIWYVAFQLSRRETEPSTELGATHLPANASEEERLEAIRDMQAVCEAIE